MPVIRIKNKELAGLLEATPPDFPKYASQIINLANQNSQGTRPKVVGKMSELFVQSKARSLSEWEEWYKVNCPEAFDRATARIWPMVQQLKEAIAKIDKEMVRRWIEDLVLVKTFVGLRFQEAILKKVSEFLSKDYRISSSAEESQGIDGWIDNSPVSIKPITYKVKMALPEKITFLMIYYSKEKDGITIEFE
ncbi:MAG: restriction endonuclease [candidate division Zixibacteria bacterium RBG_16_53_22]|nr:MAG: restriction endonuclease [candidate division Zixibacteria bacterium RBG_16_53_22]